MKSWGNHINKRLLPVSINTFVNDFIQVDKLNNNDY